MSKSFLKKVTASKKIFCEIIVFTNYTFVSKMEKDTQ